ncbi:MAG: YraN family protein [Burkholderiaceae bacterium]|jgi:putative endonuclease|nr:YraN family protein [Burkholderiaceae bacterium]
MFKAAGQGSTKAIGDDAESLALAYLQRQGLVLVQRNYRVAGGPHARGAEIDLILRERDGTLVFVEVRSRATASHGGALASVGGTKQRRIVRAAQHYLLRLPVLPACRFDVVALEGGQIQWVKAAFDAG